MAAHFKENLVDCRKAIKESRADVCLTNEEFLKVYEYSSTRHFWDDTDGIDPVEDRKFYTDQFVRGFAEIFVACANGARQHSIIADEGLPDGGSKLCEVTFAIQPGYEDTWERVILCIIPLDRMRAYYTDEEREIY